MAVTFGVLTAVRAPHPVAPLGAILRGLVQLAIISVILGGVITNPAWVGLALLVMFSIATITATRRIGWSRRHLGMVVLAMGAGVLITLGIVFATGAIDFTPRYALAIGGIVIGNSMSIATIGGRRLLESVDDRWDDVEGWLAIGATPRQSTLALAKQAIYSALRTGPDRGSRRHHGGGGDHRVAARLRAGADRAATRETPLVRRQPIMPHSQRGSFAPTPSKVSG
jgi:putative ABC transport system permease protein